MNTNDATMAPAPMGAAPAGTTTTTTTAPAHHAGATAPKSAMQLDLDEWLARVNHTVKDPSGITQPTGTGAWAVPFFECWDPIDTCAITYCCPCITFGKTHHRLHKDPSLADWSVVNASCLGWAAIACFGFHCIPNLLQRREIRSRGNPELQGDLVMDFLKAWCCNCCDLVQQDKEAAHLMATQAAGPALYARVGGVAQPNLKQEPMTYGAPAGATV